MPNWHMHTGERLGRAIKEAIKRKGVSQAELARIFGVKPPSVHGWVKTGRIKKDALQELISYFADVVGPEHWGLQPPTSDHPDIAPYTAEFSRLLSAADKEDREHLMNVVRSAFEGYTLGKLKGS